MNGSRFIQGMVFTAALTAAPLLHAAAPDQGFYFGASGGGSDIDENINRKGSRISIDDSDTMWKVFGGYQFLPGFAVEAAWVDMGKLEADIGGLSADYKLEGATLEAVGIFPMAGNFDLFAKLGAFSWDAESSPKTNAAKNSGTDLVGGLGASLRFTDTVGGRVEWQRYDGDFETDTLSAGVSFHF